MDYKLIDEYAKQETRDSLFGLASFNQDIAIFDYGCVVVQKNYLDIENVRIVSGGEAFNGDFVGQGMLTCYVQGEHSMAPSSKVILRTLRELSYNHTRGILILVSASNGNMFNFGLAVERAKNDNLRVRIIQVNDAQNDNLKKNGKKGMTGVVLLSKIAGAMSEYGKTLSDIYDQCTKIAENLKTIGINSISQEKNNICALCKKIMCKEHKMTGNLYISESACLLGVEELIKVVPDDTFREESGKLNLKPDDCVIILINHNGSLKKNNLFNFIKELIEFLNASIIYVKRIFVGNFMCSTDVAITFMKVESPDVLEYLDAPCNAPGWQRVNQYHYNLSIEEPIKGKLIRKECLFPPIRGPKLSEKVSNILLYVLQFACDALISCEKQLNIIDTERGGKGDIGSKLRLVAEVLLKKMEKNKIFLYCPFTFFESLSKTIEATIGGTMGCIYSILFEAAAETFDQYAENMEITQFMWLKAFESAAYALHKYGNVKYGDGTMYDPICSCVRVARTELEAGTTFIEAFSKGVESAEFTAALTKKDSRYPDPGAHAVGIWMRAILEGLKLTYNP